MAESSTESQEVSKDVLIPNAVIVKDKNGNDLISEIKDGKVGEPQRVIRGLNKQSGRTPSELQTGFVPGLPVRKIG